MRAWDRAARLPARLCGIGVSWTPVVIIRLPPRSLGSLEHRPIAATSRTHNERCGWCHHPCCCTPWLAFGVRTRAFTISASRTDERNERCIAPARHSLRFPFLQYDSNVRSPGRPRPSAAPPAARRLAVAGAPGTRGNCNSLELHFLFVFLHADRCIFRRRIVFVSTRSVEFPTTPKQSHSLPTSLPPFRFYQHHSLKPLVHFHQNVFCFVFLPPP